MKNSLLIAAVIVCAASAPIAWAQDKHVHDKPAMAMDMEKMKAMQAQMDTIHIVTDPEVRQRLMQEGMKGMRGMGGPMMGGMPMDGKKGEMMKHHAMMEKRMDMMQMMMEQMMQHDQMLHPMPAK
ncbi:MAG: hypothetical protein JSS40_05300 [Proteobacteria bacterium]|nr:hypothetical protein [Pseudomonadota bacterium]